MEPIDLQASLRSLQDSLRRMQALLAWSQLKSQEARPGLPPSFQMYDPTATELRNEYSLFSCMHTRARAALTRGSHAVPEGLRTDMERALAELEQQARRLALSMRDWGT